MQKLLDEANIGISDATIEVPAASSAKSGDSGAVVTAPAPTESTPRPAFTLSIKAQRPPPVEVRVEAPVVQRLNRSATTVVTRIAGDSNAAKLNAGVGPAASDNGQSVGRIGGSDTAAPQASDVVATGAKYSVIRDVKAVLNSAQQSALPNQPLVSSVPAAQQACASLPLPLNSTQLQQPAVDLQRLATITPIIDGVSQAADGSPERSVVVRLQPVAATVQPLSTLTDGSNFTNQQQAFLDFASAVTAEQSDVISVRPAGLQQDIDFGATATLGCDDSPNAPGVLSVFNIPLSAQRSNLNLETPLASTTTATATTAALVASSALPVFSSAAPVTSTSHVTSNTDSYASDPACCVRNKTGSIYPQQVIIPAKVRSEKLVGPHGESVACVDRQKVRFVTIPKVFVSADRVVNIVSISEEAYDSSQKSTATAAAAAVTSSASCCPCPNKATTNVVCTTASSSSPPDVAAGNFSERSTLSTPSLTAEQSLSDLPFSDVMNLPESLQEFADDMLLDLT